MIFYKCFNLIYSIGNLNQKFRQMNYRRNGCTIFYNPSKFAKFKLTSYTRIQRDQHDLV